MRMSGKLTPAALTAIDTWRGPIVGGATSSTDKASSEPSSRHSSAFMSRSSDRFAHAIAQLYQARADLGDEARARHLVRRTEAAEGEDARAVARGHRHSDGVHVALPRAQREAEAVALVVLHALLEALQQQVAVRALGALANLLHYACALGFRQRRMRCAPQRRRAARHALAHAQAQAERLARVRDLEEHHLVAVARGERHGGLHVGCERLHQRPRHLAPVETPQLVLSQAEDANAERVLLFRGKELEVAQLRERVGDARHRRARHPGAFGDVLVAERAFAALEAAQDREGAGDRGDEIPPRAGDRGIRGMHRLACVHFSATSSTSLPTFSPLKSLRRTSGNASMPPATTSSLHLSLPCAIQPAISRAASP